jgi:parallel beta-helix repeat protein
MKIEKNSIQDNYGIGLYVRDKSFGEIKDNKVIIYYLSNLAIL